MLQFHACKNHIKSSNSPNEKVSKQIKNCVKSFQKTTIEKNDLFFTGKRNVTIIVSTGFGTQCEKIIDLL